MDKLNIERLLFLERIISKKRALVEYITQELLEFEQEYEREYGNPFIDSITEQDNKTKTSLYILSFNHPKQFESILKSFVLCDKDFIDMPSKILINNSTDLSTTQEYLRLCQEYGFEHIKKDNIGICGARQFIAEHFDKSDSEYYIFFEDDMHLRADTQSLCRNSFKTYVKDLYRKSLSIMKSEEYDYLKLSFTEFYGDNFTQWAWYNVPQSIREEFFPTNKELPREGLSDSPPSTEIFGIKCFEDLEYYEGEFHYCNWPIWFSKKGNKKVFLDITWAKPFEQTWMSQIFQYQKKKEIVCGALKLSPIDHNRFEFYGQEERKEN